MGKLKELVSQPGKLMNFLVIVVVVPFLLLMAVIFILFEFGVFGSPQSDIGIGVCLLALPLIFFVTGIIVGTIHWIPWQLSAVAGWNGLFLAILYIAFLIGEANQGRMSIKDLVSNIILSIIVAVMPTGLALLGGATGAGKFKLRERFRRLFRRK